MSCERHCETKTSEYKEELQMVVSSMNKFWNELRLGRPVKGGEPTGRIVHILGPRGSGKTTFLGAIEEKMREEGVAVAKYDASGLLDLGRNQKVLGFFSKQKMGVLLIDHVDEITERGGYVNLNRLEERCLNPLLKNPNLFLVIVNGADPFCGHKRVSNWLNSELRTRAQIVKLSRVFPVENEPNSRRALDYLLEPIYETERKQVERLVMRLSVLEPGFRNREMAKCLGKSSSSTRKSIDLLLGLGLLEWDLTCGGYRLFEPVRRVAEKCFQQEDEAGYGRLRQKMFEWWESLLSTDRSTEPDFLSFCKSQMNHFRGSSG